MALDFGHTLRQSSSNKIVKKKLPLELEFTRVRVKGWVETRMPSSQDEKACTFFLIPKKLTDQNHRTA